MMLLAVRFSCIVALLFQACIPLHADPSDVQPPLTLNSVHVATGLWPGFTEQDEQGAYFHLMHLIFPSQTQFKVSYTSFNRSVQMVEQQQADMVIGVGMQDSVRLKYSALPFDIDHIAVLYNPTQLQISQSADLAGYRLVTQRGYNYNMVLGLAAHSYEVDDIATGISLVRSNRVDAFLVEKTELQAKVDSNQLADLTVTLLAAEPIYIGFADNERGKLLKDWWDKHFMQLYHTEELKALYQHYEGMTLPDHSHFLMTNY